MKQCNSLTRIAYMPTQLYTDISDADAVVDNFANCPLRAAMCCFVSDRQANDNNGNCAEPYDDNCVNADPADNTE